MVSSLSNHISTYNLFLSKYVIDLAMYNIVQCHFRICWLLPLCLYGTTADRRVRQMATFACERHEQGSSKAGGYFDEEGKTIAS